MDREKIESCWKNSENWKGSLFYYCKEDPRSVVPKKMTGLGWTVNFAHFRTYLQLVIIPALAFASVEVPTWLGFQRTTGTDFIVVLIDIVLLSLFCSYASSLSRLEKRGVKKMTEEEIRACSSDYKNWLWGFYFCRQDPRKFVPSSTGWCPNFAHIQSYLYTVLILSGMLVSVHLPTWFGFERTNESDVGISMLYVLLLIFLLNHLANPRRYADRQPSEVKGEGESRETE